MDWRAKNLLIINDSTHMVHFLSAKIVPSPILVHFPTPKRRKHWNGAKIGGMVIAFGVIKQNQESCQLFLHHFGDFGVWWP